MHQSYKTDNQTRWPRGWKLFHETWHDLHKDWYFVFWLNEHNELLAKCSGFEELFQARSDLQKADLARLLYLHRYGGLYADMDYLALRSQVPLLTKHPLLKQGQVLLQGRFQQVVGLEWGFARQPGHPFWTFCLSHKIAKFKEDKDAIFSTGPHMLRRCLKGYSKKKELEHMVAYQDNIMIVEPNLLAPIDAFDFNSTCGIWRTRSQHLWLNQWETSACREQLLERGCYAVTFYTQSWTTWTDK